jgi:DNA processing protein
MADLIKIPGTARFTRRPRFGSYEGAMTTFPLLSLALLPGIGPRKVRDLLARATATEVLACPEAHADLLSDEVRRRIVTGEARRAAEEEMGRVERAGARLVRWDEAAYPERLRRIYDPPALLYVLGEPRGEETAVSVVGSRGASPLGRTTAHALGRDLVRAGLTVVSGLARGIDTAAHEGAVAGGGRTVAVLGSGLGHIYPHENRDLARRIVAQGGAVVSELPMAAAPAPGNFPRRNRVIAGWSRALVVVEAAMKSGALITARVAADEGRDVMAVPGHPSHPGAAGTNMLIRDGAALVRDAADVLSELGLDPLLARPAAEAPSDALLGALPGDIPVSVEELHERSGQAIPSLLGRLAELELASKVRRLPGGLFVRN